MEELSFLGERRLTDGDSEEILEDNCRFKSQVLACIDVAPCLQRSFTVVASQITS